MNRVEVYPEESIIRHPRIFKPLDIPNRYKVMYGGRGSAKSWTVARKLLIRSLEKQIRILCTRELQKTIKQSVHKLLSLQIDMMGMRGLFNVTDDAITCNATGSEFIFMGLRHNTDDIKSLESIDFAWIEEAHKLTEASWDLIDPTIRREDSEIWVTYNTRFKHDHIHRLFVLNKPPPGAWVQKINHDDNPWFPDVLSKQMEHMREQDYEKYLHIWEGEYKQLAEGAIFGKQITQVKKEKRRTSIPVVRNQVVDTFWDIGKNDATAVFFMQKVGMEYRFIDFMEGRLEEVEHYAREIHARDYLYGTHYLPHDAEHQRLGMKRSIEEQLNDGGVKPTIIVDRCQQKMVAIQQARERFPECWFHCGDDERGARMERGWDALCQYHFVYRDEDDTFTQTPHHDWASNPADAFMQFAQGYLDPHNHNDSQTQLYPDLGL